uniref:Fatty acid 2-hydroxylase 1-like n=1 Tax=Tetraselmis sp. GSL018 TaxID=582737 RepID=A0A061S878_9CHLO|mmetsp:Transcript_15294/g.36406  ORF Transcript_15294/g.36406 Transcript_15294/m.36406 type:complete len:243 (-) Transcript_15294:136-864(-)
MRDSKWSSEEQDTYEIDLKKPLLSQVCKLGSRYDEWVHKPVAGKPTHFENPWLESFLRVPWWLIPAIWVPLTLAFAGSSLWLLRPNLTHWLSLVMAGLLSWQFIEYSIHRWLFHAKAESPGFIRFHFLHHGAHHKFPMDKGNLVMHPLPSLLIAAVLAAFILSLVQPGVGFAYGTGLAAGYIGYDMTHYFVHHAGRLPWFMEGLKRTHMDHHFRDHDVSFGVSSPLVDHVLATLPRAPCKAE